MVLAIVKRTGPVAQTHPGHSAFAGPGSSTGSSKAKIAAGINSQDVISSRLNAWHPPLTPRPLYASTFVTTWPWTSVRRKSRPWAR